MTFPAFIKPDIAAQILTAFPDNTIGEITPAALRDFLNDLLGSMQQNGAASLTDYIASGGGAPYDDAVLAWLTSGAADLWLPGGDWSIGPGTGGYAGWNNQVPDIVRRIRGPGRLVYSGGANDFVPMLFWQDYAGKGLTIEIDFDCDKALYGQVIPTMTLGASKNVTVQNSNMLRAGRFGGYADGAAGQDNIRYNNCTVKQFAQSALWLGPDGALGTNYGIERCTLVGDGAQLHHVVNMTGNGSQLLWNKISGGSAGFFGAGVAPGKGGRVIGNQIFDCVNDFIDVLSQAGLDIDDLLVALNTCYADAVASLDVGMAFVAQAGSAIKGMKVCNNTVRKSGKSGFVIETLGTGQITTDRVILSDNDALDVNQLSDTLGAGVSLWSLDAGGAIAKVTCRDGSYKSSDNKMTYGVQEVAGSGSLDYTRLILPDAVGYATAQHAFVGANSKKQLLALT